FRGRIPLEIAAAHTDFPRTSQAKIERSADGGGTIEPELRVAVANDEIGRRQVPGPADHKGADGVQRLPRKRCASARQHQWTDTLSDANPRLKPRPGMRAGQELRGAAGFDAFPTGCEPLLRGNVDVGLRDLNAGKRSLPVGEELGIEVRHRRVDGQQTIGADPPWTMRDLEAAAKLHRGRVEFRSRIAPAIT